MVRRAKGSYTGLVSSVALEKERITTQFQPEVPLQVQPSSVINKRGAENLQLTKSELINDNGVVTLMTINNENLEEMSSSESDVETKRPILPVVKKRVHEQIGKN